MNLSAIVQRPQRHLGVDLPDLPPWLQVSQRLRRSVVSADRVIHHELRQPDFARITGTGGIATVLPRQLGLGRPPGPEMIGRQPCPIVAAVGPRERGTQ